MTSCSTQECSHTRATAVSAWCYSSATRGEAGKVHPAVGRVDDLPAFRAEELRLSCTRLGIEEPMFLDFHDSGRGARLRHDDPRAFGQR